MKSCGRLLKKIEGLCIIAVQQCPDTVRITFNSEGTAINVLKSSGVDLAWVVAHPRHGDAEDTNEIIFY